jgi:hypothetical protein
MNLDDLNMGKEGIIAMLTKATRREIDEIPSGWARGTQVSHTWKVANWPAGVIGGD